MYGAFVIELKNNSQNENIQKEEEISNIQMDKLIQLGNTIETQEIIINSNEKISLEEVIELWEQPLEKIFPTIVEKNNITKSALSVKENEINNNIEQGTKVENLISNKQTIIVAKNKIAKPRVFIPVFPGTNCEYDSAKAFIDAGAEVKTVVFKNLKPEHIEESIQIFEKEIDNAQKIMFPGGFSAGDEPDGSGKFISAIFRNPKLTNAIHKHLNEQDGLILGICNGFQALIKLGLVPYGKIVEMKENMPTLTFNNIARHQSMLVTTKVVSKLSPWFSKVKLEEEFVIPISHGEGRFVANEETMAELIKNGQIATQYVDLFGNATNDIRYNPNGSIYAVEGITSPDGRVLGKMGHSERSYKTGILQNVPGNKNQKIFESGVEYYK